MSRRVSSLKGKNKIQSLENHTEHQQEVIPSIFQLLVFPPCFPSPNYHSYVVFTIITLYFTSLNDPFPVSMFTIGASIGMNMIGSHPTKNFYQLIPLFKPNIIEVKHFYYLPKAIQTCLMNQDK